jgi:LPS export ABC transporter protein LptC
VKGRLLAALGVVAILGLAFLLGRQGQTPGKPAESTGQPVDFGYVALDTEVVQTGDDGKPQYTLSAARIEQVPGSGDVDAHTLTLHYAPDDAQHWTLAAREALLPGGGTLLHLVGDVQVRGKPPGSALIAQIDTQRLDYDTRSQDVSTRDDVHVTWGGLLLDAHGMSANLKQGLVSLESKVHGRLSP